MTADPSATKAVLGMSASGATNSGRYKGCDVALERRSFSSPEPPARVLDLILDRRLVSLLRVTPIMLGDEGLLGLL